MATLELGPYVVWLIAVAAVAVGVLAWLRGGTAEKGGALMVGIAWAVVLAFEAFSSHGLIAHKAISVWVVSAPILLTDFLLSFGLLVLAMRYASLWVGGAMLAQSAQLALQAFYLGDEKGHAMTYAIGSNVCSGLLLVTLLAGTLSSWSKRTQAARRDMQLQA